MTDLTDVLGAYPIDIDGDGLADLVVCGGASRPFAWAGRLPLRVRHSDSDLGDGWTTAFSANWEGATALPTLAFGRYLVLDAMVSRRPRTTATPVCWCVRTRMAPHTLLPCDWPQAIVPCRCCSATGTAPVAAICV